MYIKMNECIECDCFECIFSELRDVSDVDLYVGILAEEPLADAILGPVGTCLVADQLVRLKRGDRFWYEAVFSGKKFLRLCIIFVFFKSTACSFSDRRMQWMNWLIRVGQGNVHGTGQVPKEGVPL